MYDPPFLGVERKPNKKAFFKWIGQIASLSNVLLLYISVIQSCAVAPPKGIAPMLRLMEKKFVILSQSKNFASFEINVNTHKSILSSIKYVKQY
jgi:hypothetical protein